MASALADRRCRRRGDIARFSAHFLQQALHHSLSAAFVPLSVRTVAAEGPHPSVGRLQDDRSRLIRPDALQAPIVLFGFGLRVGLKKTEWAKRILCSYTVHDEHGGTTSLPTS
jgi:hypothetical protein